MQPIERSKLLSLLTDRSGGDREELSKATGKVTTTPVNVPEIPIGPVGQGSQASVELEYRRNSDYSSVSVKLWASRSCGPGEEARVLQALLPVLSDIGLKHVDGVGRRTLAKWSAEPP